MKLLLLILPAYFVAAGIHGAPSTTPQVPPDLVALRYATVTAAVEALKQQLGPDATGAVSVVDTKRNAIKVEPAHHAAATVRAFLLGFDHRPPEVRVRPSSPNR
jgi:hypothetical protein